jgi:hypothetical protein
MLDKEYRINLPKQGPWRLIPATAVAEVVQASYHDKTGELHWYVPDELESHSKRVADDIEDERDARIQQFIEMAKRLSSDEGG